MTDHVLDALAHDVRQSVIKSLTREAQQNLDDVLDDCTESFREEESLRLTLHHTHLPKLDDVGAVDYDTDDRFIERGDQFETFERTLNSIQAARTA